MALVYIIIYFIILFILCFPIFIIGELLGFNMAHLSVEASFVMLLLPVVIMVLGAKLYALREIKKHKQEKQKVFDERLNVVIQLVIVIISTYKLTENFYKIEFETDNPQWIKIYKNSNCDYEIFYFEEYGYANASEREYSYDNGYYTSASGELLCNELAKRLNGYVKKEYSEIGGYIPGSVSADTEGNIRIGRPEAGAATIVRCIIVYSKKAMQELEDKEQKRNNLKTW